MSISIPLPPEKRKQLEAFFKSKEFADSILAVADAMSKQADALGIASKSLPPAAANPFEAIAGAVLGDKEALKPTGALPGGVGDAVFMQIFGSGAKGKQ